MAVVYQHIRKDTNEVFYVGIGKDVKRAYQKKSRNKYWNNIVNKAGYYVEIIYPNLEWKLACNMEQYLIEAYGRIDLGTGCLVNLTNGGDGTLGIKQSFDHIEKRVSKIRGKKMKPKSEENRKKLSENHQSKKEGYVNPMQGKKHNEVTKKKISEKAKGRPAWNKGSDHPMYGMLSAYAKSVINLENGFFYDSALSAFESQQQIKSYSTFKSMINGNRPNKTNFAYIENI
jgi:hypothetical protein